jgi:hypothetical protein
MTKHNIKEKFKRKFSKLFDNWQEEADWRIDITEWSYDINKKQKGKHMLSLINSLQFYLSCQISLVICQVCQELQFGEYIWYRK